MKKIILISIITVLVLSTISFAVKDKDGDKYTGKHYTLNIIGVRDDHPKNIDNCGEGHRIFVLLGSKGNRSRTKINLISCEDAGMGADCDDWGVLDCDGTDDGEAALMLPDPNIDVPRTTGYTVLIRALGKPGGIADVNVCATYTEPEPDEIVCGETVHLVREKGQAKKASGSQKFMNVSKELLTICVDTGKTNLERMYIFDERLRDELWNYDNQGLKHAQIRLYPIPSTYTEDQWKCN
ncbi:MAG: hypothetical protein ACYSSP_13320 [Planctomycetota bacterium]|jgi:hypothetical protein